MATYDRAVPGQSGLVSFLGRLVMAYTWEVMGSYGGPSIASDEARRMPTAEEIARAEDRLAEIARDIRDRRKGEA